MCAHVTDLDKGMNLSFVDTDPNKPDTCSTTYIRPIAQTSSRKLETSRDCWNGMFYMLDDLSVTQTTSAGARELEAPRAGP